MLEHLIVENFAIIDRVEIDFSAGLTVLTGETGAGKSILIDAISLLFGERASQDVIRSGSDFARITGRFLVTNSDTIRFAMTKDIDVEDGHIEVMREISTGSRNISRVNGHNVSLTDLRAIMERLADIHSQFDTGKLIDPKNYLTLVDGYRKDAIGTYLEHYRTQLSKYREAEKAFSILKKEIEAYKEKHDLYLFQLKELREAAFDPEEEKELKETSGIMKNYDKVFSLLSSIKQRFEDPAMLDSLSEVMAEFSELADYSGEYKDLYQRISDQYYEMEDIARESVMKLESLNYDPTALDSIEKRLFQLEKLEEKYKMDLESLANYRLDLENMVMRSDNSDLEINMLSQRVSEEREKTTATALDLTRIRKEASRQIEEELRLLFGDLGLAKTRFEISFAEKKDETGMPVLYEDGTDEIDFLISTNPGEPLRSLAKTASGGEMSRVMLAFKTIFIRSRNLETMIFDEIDTGISGVVARQIAKKIKEISKNCQVLSITHLPQVVAAADNHILVEKRIEGKRTIATIRHLDFEERVREIASMISGDKVTENAMKSARELVLEN